MSTALVTGASTGLGLEFAKLFAKEGVSLIITARSLAQLNKISDDLHKINSSIRIDTIAIDLAEPGAAQELFNSLLAKNLEVDFLINNAGFGNNGSFSQVPLDVELGMIDLNLRTLIALTHLLLPKMIANGKGRVLNVGSIAGFMPGPYMATYYASKAFVNSFSEALSVELEGTGVTCTLLTPGPTATNFAARAGIVGSKLFKLGKVASASEVARVGYSAMQKGKVLAIPGFTNRILVQSLRTAPRSFLRTLSGWLNREPA